MSRGGSGLLIVLLAASTVGCGGEERFIPAAPPQDAAALSGLPAGEGARVFSGELGQVAVSAEELALARRAGDARPDEELAARLAERKVLAMQALQAGLGQEPGVVRAWQRALAQTLVKKGFEAGHSADAIPDSTWEEIFWRSGIRPMFDHFDTFFVVDAQLICCRDNPAACANSVPAASCMRDTEPMAWEVHRELSKRDYMDAGEVQDAVKQLTDTRFPRLAAQEYSFQYNFAVPHEKQRGYTVFPRGIAQAAKDTAVGKLSTPVRSANGWHIIYVKSHMPEQHKGPDDPEVIAAVKEKFYPQMKQRDALSFIDNALKKHTVAVFTDEIRKLDWSRLSGQQ